MGYKEELSQIIEKDLKTLRSKVAKTRETYDSLTAEEKRKLRLLQKKREVEAEKLSAFYSALPESPCPTCKDHCCHSHDAVGYHNGLLDTHPDIISGKVNLEDYFVAPQRKDYFANEFAVYLNKCHFLDPSKGCNLPPKYRSATCLGFTCFALQKASGAEKGFRYLTGPQYEKLYQIGTKIREKLGEKASERPYNGYG